VSTYTPAGALFVVEVRRYDDDSVVFTSHPVAERRAGRIADGLNVNLNQESFYTAIRQAREDERQPTARRNVL
jgi:hypothetical protein